MKLIDKFIVRKPEACSDHYELFVEGDWNDGDYVSKKTRIEKETFESDDYLLYFLFYLSAWVDRRWDPRGKFNETKEWNKLFEDSDIQCDYLPYGYESSIHTVTKLKLEYVSGGTRFPVSIPAWDTLFSNEDDKEKKVLEALNKDPKETK